MPVQLLGQQSHTGLADHTALWFSSSSKDRTCGNCLWAQGFQITPAVRGHHFSRSLIFFFPYVIKEVTVQEMLKDPFRQSRLGYFCLIAKMFIILQAAKMIWGDSCQQNYAPQKSTFLEKQGKNSKCLWVAFPRYKSFHSQYQQIPNIRNFWSSALCSPSLFH